MSFSGVGQKRNNASLTPSHKTPKKWTNQMISRGWTRQEITDAMTKGKSFPAENRINPGNGATRYEHPLTKKSVVVDSKTRELLQIEGPNFRR